MHFDPDARVFVLSKWHKIQLLWHDMNLMKEYISLTTAAMKMGKRYFYSDHSNDC